MRLQLRLHLLGKQKRKALFLCGMVWSWSRLEPPFLPWSRSWLRDFGHLEPEPEPPKKVAAPQH